LSSLAGKTIFIYKDSYWQAEPVFGELHVLDSTTTTLHYAGSSSQFRDIDFWMLDPSSDYSSLETPFKGGTTITLVDWLGNSSSVKIRELKISRHLTDIKRPGSDFVVAQVSAKLQKV